MHSLGLKTAQGLVVTTAFYWDQNDETRAFSKRFAEKMGGRVPSMTQAGVYSEVAHYLKAVKAAGTDDAKKVADQMRAMPIDDFMTKGGKIREDGRIIRDMYLVQVKKPEESKGPYDYYKILRTIPGEEAYRPLDKGDCPLVKK